MSTCWFGKLCFSFKLFAKTKLHLSTSTNGKTPKSCQGRGKTTKGTKSKKIIILMLCWVRAMKCWHTEERLDSFVRYIKMWNIEPCLFVGKCEKKTHNLSLHVTPHPTEIHDLLCIFIVFMLSVLPCKDVYSPWTLMHAHFEETKWLCNVNTWNIHINSKHIKDRAIAEPVQLWFNKLRIDSLCIDAKYSLTLKNTLIGNFLLGMFSKQVYII